MHGMPACDATKCPKLDCTLKAEVPKFCKDADRPLCRIQTLVLDTVGPLSSLLESQRSGQLTPEATAEAVTQALRFLGNACSNISAERRKRIVSHLNKDLHPLMEESERFANAAPLLFGKDFEKAAKDHVDSVKSLRKLTQPRSQSKQFFRPGRPHNYQTARGGSPYRGSSRGGGRGRFRPYTTPRAAKENQSRNGGGNNRQ